MCFLRSFPTSTAIPPSIASHSTTLAWRLFYPSGKVIGCSGDPITDSDRGGRREKGEREILESRSQIEEAEVENNCPPQCLLPAPAAAILCRTGSLEGGGRLNSPPIWPHLATHAHLVKTGYTLIVPSDRRPGGCHLCYPVLLIPLWVSSIFPHLKMEAYITLVALTPCL